MFIFISFVRDHAFDSNTPTALYKKEFCDVWFYVEKECDNDERVVLPVE